MCRVPFLLFVQKMQSLGNATVSERGYGFTGKKGSPVVFKKQTVSGKEYGQMDLTGKYRTQDSEEEAACEFLDAHKAVR